MRNRLLATMLIVALLGIFGTFPSYACTPQSPPDIPQYSVDQVIYIASTTAPPCTGSLAVGRHFVPKYMGQGEWEIIMNCYSQNGGFVHSKRGIFYEFTGQMDW